MRGRATPADAASPRTLRCASPCYLQSSLASSVRCSSTIARVALSALGDVFFDDVAEFALLRLLSAHGQLVGEGAVLEQVTSLEKVTLLRAHADSGHTTRSARGRDVQCKPTCHACMSGQLCTQRRRIRRQCSPHFVMVGSTDSRDRRKGSTWITSVLKDCSNTTESSCFVHAARG